MCHCIKNNGILLVHLAKAKNYHAKFKTNTKQIIKKHRFTYFQAFTQELLIMEKLSGKTNNIWKS